MIDKFEVGKYYRWIKKDGGETEKNAWFSASPGKEKIKDGIPRKCLSVGGEFPSGNINVKFDGLEKEYFFNPSDFDLVPEPPEGWRYLANGEKLLSTDEYYCVTDNTWNRVVGFDKQYKSYEHRPIVRRIVSQPEIVEYQGEKWARVTEGKILEGDMICGVDNITHSVLARDYIGKVITDKLCYVWRKVLTGGEVKDTPVDILDRVCKNCGERNGKHFYNEGDKHNDTCHGNAGKVTGTTFFDSGKTRTKQFETDHPIFETIRALKISQATKAYALFAAQRIIENDETQDKDMYKINTIGGFCCWSMTREGYGWWGKLRDGEDPGVPGETKDKKEEKKMGSESIREALNESTAQIYMMDGWHDVHVSSGKLVFSGEQKPSYKSESEIWAKVLGSIKS